MVSPSQTSALPPPQNLDAEESVLGAMMLSPAAVDAAAQLLRPGDFYRGSHGRIFEAALSLHGRGEPVDAITLVDELARQGRLVDVGGQPRIHELAALVPAASNVAHYAGIVREMSSLRGLMRVGAELQRLGIERGGTPAELLDRAERAVFALSQEHGIGGGLRHGRAGIALAYEEAVRRHEEGGPPPGLATGFVDLDRMLGGVQPGNLVVVGARPSMGKSGLMLGVASNLVVRQGVPVALFTLEMNEREVDLRLLALEAKVESQTIRAGGVDKEGWGRLSHAANLFTDAPLYVEDSALVTMAQLRSDARRLKLLEPGLALVCVDYLQLMTPSGSEESRVQQVSQISRELKLLARDLDVVVMALSQLSRSLEQRHDKRPFLSDLRDSGAIEQDADIVLFIYRDEYYHEESDQRGIAELNIAKHRNGPTGTVRLSFVKRFARFGDLAPLSIAGAPRPPEQ